MHDGLLLINKPIDWTSHDVVAKVRNILKKDTGLKVKVGHTGTLDPLASGLMVLTVGSYCKRAAEFSKLDKTYKATLKLGETSSTGDDEGEKTPVSKQKPSEEEINAALNSFIGEINQTPPAYSAVKINGKRAYKLAREGKEVKLEPRQVKIYSVKLINYSYPTVDFEVEVSSGTYIRSLAEDIGQKLGTGAYLSGLERTKVGSFSLDQTIGLTGVNIDKLIKI